MIVHMKKIKEENKINEIESFYKISKDILENKDFLSLKNYCQHGTTSVYDHSLNVAYLCYLKAKTMKNVDINSLVRGALLHDFFLYDWHIKRKISKRKGLHGYTHPLRALINASKQFSLNRKEKNIIRSHMWPLTFFHIPLSKEAWLVCFIDKVCSIKEMQCKKYKKIV